MDGGDLDGDIFSKADLSVSCTPISPECKLRGELILKQRDCNENDPGSLCDFLRTTAEHLQLLAHLLLG